MLNLSDLARGNHRQIWGKIEMRKGLSLENRVRFMNKLARKTIATVRRADYGPGLLHIADCGRVCR